MNHSQIFEQDDLIRQRKQLMPEAIKLQKFWQIQLKKVCRQLDKYKPLKPIQK